MTNEQLKTLISAEIGMGMINFVDVLCAVEALCARWRVPSNQANEVIPMVLETRFTEDQLFIRVLGAE